MSHNKGGHMSTPDLNTLLKPCFTINYIDFTWIYLFYSIYLIHPIKLINLPFFIPLNKFYKFFLEEIIIRHLN